MLTNPRVLVVGTGSLNADYVARALSENGVVADWTNRLRFPNPLTLRKFDVIYGIYLQSCSRQVIVGKLLGKKTIIHFVGSDAYWYARERSIWRRIYWKIALRATDLILYVSPHLMQIVRRRGIVLPLPIEADEFARPEIREVMPERDVLYYCPSGETNERIYRLPWIIEYARSHPNEKITIVGNQTHPANYDIPLPNVYVIPSAPQTDMPALYRKHKRLVRMTSEDGLPRMIHEALLAGIGVTYNGEEVEEIPEERNSKKFAQAFAKVLGKIFDSG